MEKEEYILSKDYMKTAIFSTSRADFGILEALLKKKKQFNYLLFIGGMHLLPEFGNTLKDAEKYNITDTFDFLESEDNKYPVTRSLGKEFYELSNIFSKFNFDAILILGDRFELLPIIQTAMIYKKAIFHLHGGEITEGAFDEQIRHMITKASHLHFPSCEEYAQNIRKMGEEEWRIHNVGALFVDNIKTIKSISRIELFNELELDYRRKTITLTYHPVTLEFVLNPTQQFLNLVDSLETYDGQIVITAPNIDPSYSEIFKLITNFSKKENVTFVKHLGMKKYISLIPHCEFLIGNSSSGLIEVPFFKIPTINIGDRQKGRIRHESIIDTDYSVDSIREGINKALDTDFRNSLKDMPYKFGDGNAADKIIEVIKNTEVNQKLLRKKLEFPK